MQTLACQDISSSVEKYNRDYPEEDRYLRAALRVAEKAPITEGRLLSEVCLIADWGSISIQWFPFDERISMAKEIQRSWPILVRMLGQRWNGNPAELAQAVEQLKGTKLLRPDGVKKRKLSFLSKYLHWRINEAFPVWDKRAKGALNFKETDGGWSDYCSWITEVWDVAQSHGQCCLKAARLSDESVLRTLDKALYIMGE